MSDVEKRTRSVPLPIRHQEWTVGGTDRQRQHYNTDTLRPVDIRNLALQRTGALARLPGLAAVAPSFEVWKRLNSNLLLDMEVRLRRSAILDHSFEEIEAEFYELIDQIVLSDDLRVCDIGCGLGVVDILLCQRVAVSRLALVDIDYSSSKHHGFRAEGAGYNSLATAASFVADNIPDGTRIETLNPSDRDVQTLGGYFDLITSFLSCGYHYPVLAYLEVFKTMLTSNGQIILDLRNGQDHHQLFDDFEIRHEISVRPDSRRVVLARRDLA